MFTDARRDGVELMVTSGYRKPEIQKYLFDFWVSINGSESFDAIARPGYSEHQLGSTVDLTDSSINFAGVDKRFGTSRGGDWMQKNAYKYGFIMSFPEGKKNITGFEYEPWHWRFIETASDSDGFPDLKDDIRGLELSADSFLAVLVKDKESEKVLVEKNTNRQLPIASITKLMVALVASERYKNNDIISISRNSLRGKGVTGIYKEGNRFLFSDALRALLMASHNEIANAMAEQSLVGEFLSTMNKKAVSIGLSDTVFFNVTGLDPTVGSEEINHSTAFDIYKLAKYIQENYPNLFSITSRSKFKLFDVDGNFITTIINTDKLLNQQNIPLRILGSKTGETPRAKQNLVVVSAPPCVGKIFSVILGSQNSFEDMRKLMWYVHDSYQWTCSPSYSPVNLQHE